MLLFSKHQAGQKVMAMLTMCSVLVLMTACGGSSKKSSSGEEGVDGFVDGLIEAPSTGDLLVEADFLGDIGDPQLGDLLLDEHSSSGADGKVSEPIMNLEALDDLLPMEVGDTDVPLLDLSDNDMPYVDGGGNEGDNKGESVSAIIPLPDYETLPTPEPVPTLEPLPTPSPKDAVVDDSSGSAGDDKYTGDKIDTDNVVTDEIATDEIATEEVVTEEIDAVIEDGGEDEDKGEVQDKTRLAFSHQYPLREVDDAQRLNVFAPYGDIVLTSQEGDEPEGDEPESDELEGGKIKVIVDVLAGDTDQAEMANQIFADDFPFEWMNKDDGNLQLRAKPSLKHLLDSLMVEDGETPLTIQLSIPSAMNVSMHGHSGRLDVDQYHGDLYVEDSTGPVTLMGSEGKFCLTSSASDLKVVDHRGDMEVSTQSGDVDLAGVAGDIRVGTQQSPIKATDIDGKMHIDCDEGDIQLKRVRGDVEVVSGEGDISIADHQGDLTLISDAGGDFSVHEPDAAIDEALNMDGKTVGEPEVADVNPLAAAEALLEEKSMTLGLGHVEAVINETVMSSVKPTMPMLPQQEK